MLAFLLIGISILGFKYYRLHDEFSAFKALHEQSVTLTTQMLDIKSSLATIDRTLNQLNKFSSKLKVIARIKNSMTGEKLVQKSKNKKASIPELIPHEPPTSMGLEKIKRKVKDLQSEAQTQERYLAELDDFFGQNETLLASVPSISPVWGRITSKFGFRKTPFGQWKMHEGVDLGANFGSRVVAPADGLVEYVGYSNGYGRHIVLDHGFGVKTIFAHASSLLVKAGQFVKRGSKIALVGRTGHTRGVHLHYEVRLDNVPLDPSDFMFN